MPEPSIDQPPRPSQNLSPRSASFAGNSTCTIFLPISPPRLSVWPGRYTLPRMVKAVVLYDDAPDPERYAAHAELCQKVPGGTFRHGRVFGAPAGKPEYAYYAEWEFADMDAFKTAARSEEFMATGKDAREMGGRITVMFAEVD